MYGWAFRDTKSSRLKKEQTDYFWYTLWMVGTFLLTKIFFTVCSLPLIVTVSFPTSFHNFVPLPKQMVMAENSLFEFFDYLIWNEDNF